MKILSNKNVFDAALDRIRYLFSEFPNVVIGISGGKDSTIVFQLGMRVAKELGRLPLPVFFLDQEAEWTTTIDYVREVMYRPDVKPLWLQMPMHMDNAASFETKFLKCWDPACEADWVHPKDPISMKENVYGTDRFKELFPAIFKKLYPGQKLAVIAGVRCEESPGRLMGLTHDITYKWITWGIKLTKPNQFTFYPIYDWSYTDVWHAIHSEKWPYNCNTGDALVWMGDFSFKRIDSVKPGDEIIGFTDEGNARKRDRLVRTTVEQIGSRRAPVVKITMASGRVLRCTSSHRWMCCTGAQARNGRWYYRPAKVDDHIAFVVEPVEPGQPTKEGAWLGGIWDGEGHRRTIVQSLGKNREVSAEIERALTAEGIRYTVHSYDKARPDMRVYIIAGGRDEARSNLVRFINRTRPIKAATLDRDILGSRFRRGDRVISIEPDGNEIVYGLQTASRNYIVRGYASSNSIYNYQYRYGVPVRQMRVSNLHHETAVRSLFHLQEIDPALYERLAKRLPGVDTAGKFGEQFYARKLPFMFKDWCEYRDYLIDKLTANDPAWQQRLIKLARKWDDLLADAHKDKQTAASAIVQSILCNDYTGTKTENFRTSFIEKYRHDRADYAEWHDDRLPRAQDPRVFDWFRQHILYTAKGGKIEKDGRRIYVRGHYKHWIEGDVLCREFVR